MNTTTFTRNGLIPGGGGYGPIDNLTFTYNGNQKVKITDAVPNIYGLFYGDEEFVQNGVNTGNSCAYDANGNRLYDSNSNIWGIQYNTLNLPDAMQFYQGHQTNYTYSAAGAKLKVIDKTAPAGAELPITSLNSVLTSPSVSFITTTDYVGNVIYENGTMKRILTPVGYWQAGTFYYFLKDHLGSNRVVINGSGGIAETSSYYPSGMRFGESAVNGGSVQPYRHTGHEMQEMHGLNWIDNLARFRTVSDGSGFTGVDLLAEKRYSISPYVYCSGNPVNRIDPDGRDEFLLTWLPKGDAVGHSAVAIEERDSKGNSTGNLIVRHLWPKGGSVEIGKSIDADYRNEVIAMSDLASFNGGEGRGADGIIKIKGDAHQDNVMSASLDLDEENNQKYEMPNNDCATYSKGAVESVGINGSVPSTVKFAGSTSGITYKSVDATTPGSVHKAVAESGDKRVKMIKSLPQGNGNPNIEIKAPDKVILNHLKNSN